MSSWPIEMGRDFLSTYDLFSDAPLLLERRVHEPGHRAGCNGLDDPRMAWLPPKAAIAKLREEVEIAKGLLALCAAQAYRGAI